MGRAPCCDKANVKKGPWAPEEDARLKSYIEQHGTGGNWIALPQKVGLKRCGKSCRLRWLNYLRPNIRHGGFSEEEDRIICSLYVSIGSRWSIIAAQLPGRTDNDIKNYWNTRLKKKLLGKQRKSSDHIPGRRGKRSSAMMVLDHHHHHANFNPPPMAAAAANPYNHNNVDHLLIPYWTPQAPLHPTMSSLTSPITTDTNCTTLDEFGVAGFTDQNSSSLRSQMMVKIEGRLTDDRDHHHQQSINYANYHQQGEHDDHQQQLMMNLHLPYMSEDQSLDMTAAGAINSSSAMDNLMMSNVYGSLEELGQSIMVQDPSHESNSTTAVNPPNAIDSTRDSTNFPVELEQLMSSNNTPLSSSQGRYNSANLDHQTWNEMILSSTIGSAGSSTDQTSCGGDESIESWGEMSSLISLPIPPPMHLSSADCGDEFHELRYTGVQ